MRMLPRFYLLLYLPVFSRLARGACELASFGSTSNHVRGSLQLVEGFVSELA